MFFSQTKNIPQSPLLNRKSSYYEADKRFVWLIVIVSVLLALFSTHVFAENAISKLCETMEKYISGQDYSNIIALLSFDNGIGLTLWSSVDKYYAYIAPIGYGLIGIYFLLNIIEKTQMDNLTPEHLVKCMLKLFIAYFLILNGLEILKDLINLGSEIMGKITQATPSAASIKHEKLGLFAAIGRLIMLFIPWVLTFAARLVTTLTAFSRLIQIGIYGIFAPIGMANIYEGGTNSSGFRYLKKFFAVILQGAVMIGILALTSAVSSQLLNNVTSGGGEGFGEFLQVCALSLTQVMLIVRSQSWANDIVGV